MEIEVRGAAEVVDADEINTVGARCWMKEEYNFWGRRAFSSREFEEELDCLRWCKEEV